MTNYRIDIPLAEQASEVAPLVTKAMERGMEIPPVLAPGNIDLPDASPAVRAEEACRRTTALGNRFEDNIPARQLGDESENHRIPLPCGHRDDGTVHPRDGRPAGGLDTLSYDGERWKLESAVPSGLSDGAAIVDLVLAKAVRMADRSDFGVVEHMREDGTSRSISAWHLCGQDPQWAFDIFDGCGLPIRATEFHHSFDSRDGVQAQAVRLGRAMAGLLQLGDRCPIPDARGEQLLDEPCRAPSFEAFMGEVMPGNNADGGRIPDEPKPDFALIRDMVAETAWLCGCNREDVADIEAEAEWTCAHAYCLELGRLAEPDEHEAWSASVASGGATSSHLVDLTVGFPASRAGHTPEFFDDLDYRSRDCRLLPDRELDDCIPQILYERMSCETAALANVGANEFSARHAVLSQPRGRSARTSYQAGLPLSPDTRSRCFLPRGLCRPGRRTVDRERPRRQCANTSSEFPARPVALAE